MPTLNRTDIENLIPHRRTMLLLEQVNDYTPGQTLSATMHVQNQAVFLDGHFDGQPILPGVMQLEAMAQAAAVLTSLTENLTHETAAYLFSGVEKLRWKSPVEPGDTLVLEVEMLQEKMGLYKFSGTARVADTITCIATFTAKLIRK